MSGPLAPPFPRPPMSPAQRSLRPRVRRAVLQAAGRVYRRTTVAKPPRRILLIRPDHLGDLLFLTPGLHALRRALPSARITLLAGPWGADAVRNNADLDNLLICPFPGFERRPKESSLAPYRLLAAHARKVRAGGYDTAVMLRFDHWWGAWLAAAAGIPRRIGYDLPEVRPFLTQPVPYRAGRHEVLQNVTLFAALVNGLDAALGPTRYFVTESDRAWAAAWLTEQGVSPVERLAAIHPGAGAVVKQWPVDNWAHVGDALAERGLRVVLTGGGGERALCAAVAEKMRGGAVLDSAGETTFGQLAALYERCQLVLGADSGPLHLAVAVNAPTVHLYGPAPAAKFGPWGDAARHVVLATDWPCAPCDRLDWPVKVLAAHACMARISPAAVLQAAGMLLESNGLRSAA